MQLLESLRIVYLNDTDSTEERAEGRDAGPEFGCIRVILSEEILKILVAGGFYVDIIVSMSTKYVICSSLKAAAGLSSLLLRRLAR